MFIKVTRIFKQFTEEAKERIDKELEEWKKSIASSFMSNDSPSDELGRNADYFKELGIPVPEELQSEGGIENLPSEFKYEFKDEDFITNRTDTIINLDSVEYMDDLLKERGTVITFHSGRDIIVEQKIEEIQKLISNG